MTRREKAQIRKAISLLMQGDFLEGMGILAPMVDIDYPAARLMKDVRPVDLREIAARPDNQSFQVKEPRK